MSDFISRHFSRKALPYWCVLAVDCIIVTVSLILAHMFNDGVAHAFAVFWPYLLSLVIYLVFYLIGFKIFKTYSGIIRYSSFTDLWKVGCAVFLGSVLVQLARWCFKTDEFLAAVSAHDLALGSLIAIILMWLERVVIKIAFDRFTRESKFSNVLVFGTREGGVGIAKSIKNQHPASYRVCGFVTVQSDMIGHRLMDSPIFGPEDNELWRLIVKKDVKQIYISPLVYDYFVNECQPMIDRLISMGVDIMVVPHSFVWDGKSPISHAELKPVSVEDLLPRDKIDVDMEAIGKMLSGRRILVTGGAGSIGSEIVRQVAEFKPEELVIVDQAETPMHDMRLTMQRLFPDVKVTTIVASITCATVIEEVFRKHRPQYVFHAAAYKHVPMMEDNPAVAVLNNIAGTRIIADLAVKFGTSKFVMISTDKAVNPANVMGCSKRICEIYCQSLNEKIQSEGGGTQFVTTRFGNVLGSNGSVIPIFMEQIRRGGPVTVTHKDIVRYFMLIPEACRLVLEAGTMGEGGEIFVFDMGSPVRIADLAKRMIDLSGAKEVKIEYTGLRDGEKLFEEVLSDAETTLPTDHPKIKVARVRRYSYEDALRNEEELMELCQKGDPMEIVAKMKEIVPEFRSCHSVYSELDNKEQ